MSTTPDNAAKTGISPKKKRKLSRASLLGKATDTVAGVDDFLTIGQIYRLAVKKKTSPQDIENKRQGLKIAHSEKGSTGDQEIQEVEKGSIKFFRVRCVITDNRTGRIAKREKERNFRFINVADATGTKIIGMKTPEAKLFGLIAFDLDDAERSETAFCFFNAEISGSLSWVQSSTEPPGVPTFYLNKGLIRSHDCNKCDTSTRLIFPTTEICRLMVTGRFAFSNKFATTGICGKVDAIEILESEKIMLSLEDPVGYIAVAISLKEDDEHKADKYVQENGMEVGKVLFLLGKLSLSSMNSGENALIETNSNEIVITEIEKAEFNVFAQQLCDMDPETIMGIAPEKMSSSE